MRYHSVWLIGSGMFLLPWLGLYPDIVLVRSDPRDVSAIIVLARATYRKMVQNLWWATGYNVVAIPLAAGVLYRQGILLSPAMAAVFMSLSTVIVAINAQLLTRLRTKLRSA